MNDFFIPFILSTFLYKSVSSLWPVFRFLQTEGQIQEGREHTLHNFISLPFIRYILADGPPRSDRYPLKSGNWIIFSISLKIDLSDLLTICLPWWAAIAQKLHPPKHPR